MNRDIESLILKTLKEVIDREGLKASGDLTKDTRLFGQNGLLDSLGLVTLVIAVEQAIADQYNISVSLADEKAMSQKHSPYRNVASLAEYANNLMVSTV